MKRIEDIEKLSPGQLEEASLDAVVPEGLEERLRERLLAESEAASDGIPARKPLRSFAKATIPALAIAAAIATVLLVHRPSEPVDSFDDPMTAYAQVEDTFRFISQKMSGGVSIVREAENIAARPEAIINKINGK
ncbi:MAG: hypothetical protein IJ222_06880 [Bacteroidales bacterium]|nr:hypothetical protein [Bacteroidales bacterium]